MATDQILAAVFGEYGQPGGVERYRGSFEISRFPLGENQELVYSPLTRVAATVPGFTVRLLQGCRSFASLEEHTQRLVGELNLRADQVAVVRQQLSSLAESGLLASHGALLERCRRQTRPQRSPLRIGALGVPTRNRTDSLHRCVRSFLESNHSGRSLEVVVADDSDEAHVRAENQRTLQALRAQYQTPIFYAGLEQRQRFAEALIAQTGVSAEVVQFGLLNVERCPVTTGCSRNALLLHTVGEGLLQADDDTLCRLSANPDGRSGVAFSSRADPTEFWFLSPGEPVCEDALEKGNLLALHESLLGKSPGECVPADGELDLDHSSAGFFRRMEEGGQVLLTCAGALGDSGMGSSAYLLTLEGRSRARLLHTEESYRHALTRQQVLRAVPCPTLSDGSFCMALNLGLDNRQLLPPFMPVQRNQDAIFAAVVRSCLNGYLGFVPWTVLHQAPERRCLSPESFWRGVVELSSGQIVQALVSSFAPGPSKGDGCKNLLALGQSLRDWAAAPAAEFTELVRMLLWNQVGRQVLHLETQLHGFGGQPEFWANDVRSMLGALRQAVSSSRWGIPSDLCTIVGEEQAGVLLQRLVGRFGQLLQAWPVLVEAARDLRARGRRLAEAVV